MTNSISHLDIMRKLGPGGRARPREIQSGREELTQDLQKYMHVLGPTPKYCLETLVDLGLSDPEIARSVTHVEEA